MVSRRLAVAAVASAYRRGRDDLTAEIEAADDAAYAAACRGLAAEHADRPTLAELQARRRVIYEPSERPPRRICASCATNAEHVARLTDVWPAVTPIRRPAESERAS